VNLHAQRPEARDVRRDLDGDRRDVPFEGGHVHLKSNAIEWNSPPLEILDHGINRIGLAIPSFALRFVVKPQCLRIGLMCPTKNLLDVGRSSPCEPDPGLVVPDGISDVAILIQSLIDHIPCEDLILVVLHHPSDMFAQNARPTPGCESIASQPIWIIVVPDQAMTSYFHPIGAREANTSSPWRKS
jgi:hypothetical protein